MLFKKAIEQIKFIENLDRAGNNAAMFFFIEEIKNFFLSFSQGTLKVS